MLKNLRLKLKAKKRKKNYRSTTYSLFHKNTKQKEHSIVTKRRQTTLKRKFKIWTIRIFIFAIITTILLGTILGLINIAYYLKTGKWIYSFSFKKRQESQEFIIGIQNVPKYPLSEFVFKDIIKTNDDLKNPVFLKQYPPGYTKEQMQTLYTFLISGNSVYLIDPKASWEQAKEFYKQKLPQYGWKLVLDVNSTTTNKIPGLYFWHPKYEIGLHIYTKTKHDIWYETLNKKQTDTGLSQRVVIIKQKNLELQAKTGKSLPSNTFWQLKYPSNLKVTTTLAKQIKVPNIYFSDKNNKINLHIIALKYTPNPPDLLTYTDLKNTLIEFIKDWKLEHNVKNLSVSGLKYNKLIIQDTKALEACMQNKTPNKQNQESGTSQESSTTDINRFPNLCFLIIPNRANTIYYVFVSWGEDTSFYNYVKQHIQFTKK